MHLNPTNGSSKSYDANETCHSYHMTNASAIYWLRLSHDRHKRHLVTTSHIHHVQIHRDLASSEVNVYLHNSKWNRLGINPVKWFVQILAYLVSNGLTLDAQLQHFRWYQTRSGQHVILCSHCIRRFHIKLQIISSVAPVAWKWATVQNDPWNTIECTGESVGITKMWQRTKVSFNTYLENHYQMKSYLPGKSLSNEQLSAWKNTIKMKNYLLWDRQLTEQLPTLGPTIKWTITCFGTHNLLWDLQSIEQWSTLGTTINWTTTYFGNHNQ